jgi:hypothetical protein
MTQQQTRWIIVIQGVNASNIRYASGLLHSSNKPKTNKIRIVIQGVKASHI